MAVTTVPVTGLGARSPHFNYHEIVAAPLVQRPRYADTADERWDGNAQFIASARQRVPRLIDETRRLRTQLDASHPRTTEEP